MLRYIFVCAAFGLAVTPASAATVNYQLGAQVKVGNNSAVSTDEVSGGLVPLADNAVQSAAATDSVSFGPGSGSASASYDIDQEAGRFRFGTRTDITAPSSPVASRASANFDLTLAETFTITGTGNITFRLGIDGMLATNTTRNDGGEGSRYNALIRLADTSSGFDVLGTDRAFANAGVGQTALIDELLEFSVNITESKDYLFNLSLSLTSRVSERGLGNSGSSFADFTNTAFLWFEADDTLTVTAADSRFLSNATGGPVSPVPLPAGMWMLLLGVGGFSIVRRRQLA